VQKAQAWGYKLLQTYVYTVVGIALFGEQSIGKMLVLSIQLPFAAFPLILFTGNRKIMGKLTSPTWMAGLAWIAGLTITGLNIWLLRQILF
jgi:manganese transport protein